MSNMLDVNDKEAIEKRREELSPWPTSLYLKHGLSTRSGVNMIKLSWFIDTMEDAIGGLDGKRFLDVGSNSGHLALELALRGAGEVVAIEPHPVNYERCEFVYTCRGLLGNPITLTKDTMESISPETHGKFDGVFFLGTIYHTEKPWEVMKSIGDTTDLIIVEARLAAPADVNEKVGGLQYFKHIEPAADHFSLHRHEAGVIRKPTRKTLHQIIRRAGFEKILQIMPIDTLTAKYQEEENIAFLARRGRYSKPLADQVID